MKQLKVAIVGCGGIAAVHAAAWGSLEGAEIVAACDADIDRARGMATSAHTSPAACLDTPGLDIVDICTPPDSHPAVLELALQRGLAVLCEKPLARTAAEARPLVELAESRNIPLMTAFCHRFHPPVQVVLGAVQHGTLGRILMFRNRFGGRFEGVASRWFSRRMISGGGVLLDTSIHSIDLFRHLVGEVVEASARTACYNPEIEGVEDSAVMTLQAQQGALGVIEASWHTPWSANLIEIYGEEGAAIIDYDTGSTRLRRREDSRWEEFEVGAESRFEREIAHFAAVVRGEEALLVTGRDGLRALEILEQALGR